MVERIFILYVAILCYEIFILFSDSHIQIKHLKNLDV